MIECKIENCQSTTATNIIPALPILYLSYNLCWKHFFAVVLPVFALWSTIMTALAFATRWVIG